MMMMEEGKVRLTDPVSKFIPELKGLQVAVSQPAQGPPPPPGTQAEPRYYTVPADHEITVRELLTHTSGLVSGNEQQQRQPQSGDQGHRVALRVSATAGQHAARVPAGTRWAYSAQAGFDVLLHIVEIAVGPAGRRVPQAAHLRSARHEGHVLLPGREPAAGVTLRPSAGRHAAAATRARRTS
jgi:CubicO group peptidase (beta-lactamase class C family)